MRLFVCPPLLPMLLRLYVHSFMHSSSIPTLLQRPAMAIDEEVQPYESTAVFKPVVQLDEVETKTHEEDEETLYKM